MLSATRLSSESLLAHSQSKVSNMILDTWYVVGTTDDFRDCGKIYVGWLWGRKILLYRTDKNKLEAVLKHPLISHT